MHRQCTELIANAAGVERNYGSITSRHKKRMQGWGKGSSSPPDHPKALEKGKVSAERGSELGLSAGQIPPRG